ncbi:MAG: hypothetical protein ACPMAQ_07360 [Phycisphaerae bacterium]
MNPLETRTRPLWRRVLRGIMVGAVAVFLLALTAWLAWGYVEARQLNAEIARIRAAGEPVTFEDLRSNTASPVIKPSVETGEADDAGPYYEAALALLRDRDAKPLWDACGAYRDALRTSPTSRPTRNVAESVEQLLTDNALALDMLDRGAQCPTCRFNIGIEFGMGRCLEQLARARAAAKLLAARTLVRASQGRGDEAVESLISLLRLRRMFDPPITIAYLVEMASVSLACEDTAIILELCRPSDAALMRLGDALLTIDGHRSMETSGRVVERAYAEFSGETSNRQTLLERSVLAERVYGLQCMRDLISDRSGSASAGNGTGPLPGQWPAAGFWMRPMALRWAAEYLRDLGEFVQLARRPLPEALHTIRGSEPARSTFGRLVAPALGKMFVQTGRANAEVGCAAVAIAVERYRRARNRLPASLDELVPEYARSLPTDPFTGKELLYHHDEKGYVVYSIGENGKDDGGQVEQNKKGHQPADIGIRIRQIR